MSPYHITAVETSVMADWWNGHIRCYIEYRAAAGVQNIVTDDQAVHGARDQDLDRPRARRSLDDVIGDGHIAYPICKNAAEIEPKTSRLYRDGVIVDPDILF